MDKNTKNALMNLAILGISVGLGTYTQNVSWNPTVRLGAHFFGAITVPGISSAIASGIIGSYEEAKTKKLDKKVTKFNKKIQKTNDITKKEKLEKKFEEFKEKNEIFSEENIEYHINPKLRENLMKSSTVLGTVGYIAFCAAWEGWQFSQSHIFQLPQYIADVSAPIIGMKTIGMVDLVPIAEKITNFENKLKGKIKGEKTNHVPNQEKSIIKEEILPSWDLKNWTNQPNRPIPNMNRNFNHQPIKQKIDNERSL